MNTTTPPCRPERVLAFLTDTPGPQLTPQVARAVGTSLTVAGQILRHLEIAGCVARAGQGRSGPGAPPANRWKITSGGRARLADYQGRTRARRDAAARRADRRREVARRQQLVAGTRASLPAQMTPDQRRALALALRDKGLTLENVGEVFGMSPQGAMRLLKTA
jgi:hypothetical protein